MAESIAGKALEFVKDGALLGLGTGRAATEFVHALGERVRDGLRVRTVSTSKATADLARQLGIPLLELHEVGEIDLTIDGADEVAPSLDVIKGYGGAHVREKVVAASSKQLVLLVGKEKIVSRLGERGKLPVEVVPFALPLCERQVAALGCPGKVRMDGDRRMITDNGNYILDLAVGPLDDPAGLDSRLLAIPGVVGTGLFLSMADAVLVQFDDRVEVRRRAGRAAGGV